MIAHNYDRIVYIATGSAKYPYPPGAIAIGTAKAGLVAFAKYIAQECSRYGIRTNMVEPVLMEAYQKKTLLEIKQQYAAITTLGRLDNP